MSVLAGSSKDANNSLESDGEVLGSAGHRGEGRTAEEIQAEQWRNKKKASSEAKLKQVLSDIHKMMNTPSFVPTYFKSREGQLFTKVHF